MATNLGIPMILKNVHTLRLVATLVIFLLKPLHNNQIYAETVETSQLEAVCSNELLRSLGEDLNLPPTSAPTTIDPNDVQSELDQNTAATEGPNKQKQETANKPVTSGAANSTETPKTPVKCMDDNYCLNGGACIISETGQMECICPDSFYGARCQTRNICKTIIVASMTGDQICAKIGRECFKNDKFFRCSCLEDEYFVFKANAGQFSRNPSVSARQPRSVIASSTNETLQNDSTPGLTTDTAQNSSGDAGHTTDRSSREPDHTPKNKPYLAECYKIDRCLAVRCRRLSEVCVDGECVCNQDLGYIRHPDNGMCELIDPCKIPQKSGEGPICGEAKCVATYDSELYKCVCPVGYKSLKIGVKKSTTQCVPVDPEFTACDVPLLNKCQHICRMDRGSRPRCSCLNGYNPGSRVGIDDHMCFFDEHVGQRNFQDDSNQKQRDSSEATKGPNLADDFIYRKYIIKKHPRLSTNNDKTASNAFTYDPLLTMNPADGALDDFIKNNDGLEECENCEAPRKIKSEEFIIRREPRPRRDSKDRAQTTDEFGSDINRLSPQHRCNNFCEENKICVLESGSTDSYRCVCDRQGYASVGDRCLDWCAAAEFSFRVRGLLENVCLSGICKPLGLRPPYMDDHQAKDEHTKLAYDSSWRPTFECDCANSPLLVQDSTTKLCKLDFEAILNPCKPGNVGYIDCVENKNAYCAVLHKPTPTFIRGLLKERPNEMGLKNPDDITGDDGKAEMKAKDKQYTCVCSPEKKFLVDKPRNKATCVDECELLNVECGRFNRMCREATIAPEDFAAKNLIRFGPDGIRMNFKRTGCECLPGFNVGPEGLVDFTLEDNNQEATLPANHFDLDAYSQIQNILNGNNNDPNSDKENSRAKYINIKSHCFLDFDVVEFHVSFKAPHDFDPSWLTMDRISVSKDQVTDRKLYHHDNQGSESEQKREHPIEQSQPSTTNSTERDPREIPTGAIDKNQSEEWCKNDECLLKMPEYIKTDISKLNKEIVLVAQCDPILAPLSIEAYQECIRYRYWLVHKLRKHFIDWRRIMSTHLSRTFDLMDGNIRVHVNTCKASVKNVFQDKISKSKAPISDQIDRKSENGVPGINEDQGADTPLSDLVTDPQVYIDADIDCELTLHTANDGSTPRKLRKVLLEKQLQKFIFSKPDEQFGEKYYLMAPNMLIRRETFDQLADHRRQFTPCKSKYAYCDKQTKCEPVDPVNFTCTCETGYTPIGSRDIYRDDSRKEVCEDINECLFDVCKDLANVSTCINEIGDYRCQCNRHYTGDNKRYCTHVCNTIPCAHGKCRLVDDHHAFCECEDGYKETDCSVQDPNVALRKANMIICGAIFTSVLLLAITFAISLNSQLKKTKRKLKRLEAANEAGRMYDFAQQPFRPRNSKTSVN